MESQRLDLAAEGAKLTSIVNCDAAQADGPKKYALKLFGYRRFVQVKPIEQRNEKSKYSRRAFPALRDQAA